MRGAIPGADLQMAVMGKIVQQWYPHPTHILDLGCGDGILGRYLLQHFPSAQGTFVDFSEPMLAAVRPKLAAWPTAQVITADFSTPQWMAALPAHQLYDVIVSGYAIHHQPDDRKRAIYREVYECLSPGGIFLNLEHVASQTPAGEQLFDEFFVDHLYAYHAQGDSHASRAVIAAQYYQRPDQSENILAPLEAQCDWLRQLGFRDVDCFFKTFELALFGGRK